MGCRRAASRPCVLFTDDDFTVPAEPGSTPYSGEFPFCSAAAAGRVAESCDGSRHLVPGIGAAAQMRRDTSGRRRIDRCAWRWRLVMPLVLRQVLGAREISRSLGTPQQQPCRCGFLRFRLSRTCERGTAFESRRGGIKAPSDAVSRAHPGCPVQAGTRRAPRYSVSSRASVARPRRCCRRNTTSRRAARHWRREPHARGWTASGSARQCPA